MKLCQAAASSAGSGPYWVTYSLSVRPRTYSTANHGGAPSGGDVA